MMNEYKYMLTGYTWRIDELFCEYVKALARIKELEDLILEQDHKDMENDDFCEDVFREDSESILGMYGD